MTHTHSGPHVAEVLAWKDDPVVPSADPHYLAFMREQTLAAAVDAWKSPEPARAAWTTADVRGIAGGNRIDPEGAEDPEAGLLILRQATTRNPLAVVSIYGMHPTVLHEDSTLVSSDFIGFVRAGVEEASANLDRARSDFEKLKCDGPSASVVRTAEYTVFGAEEELTLARAEVTGEAERLREKYRYMEIQVIRLGDTIVAAWPGEFFVEYGLEFKRRAGGRAFVVTMANGDLQGYVVTPQAEAARGYEAQMSLFAASVGFQFVEETLNLTRKLS